MTFISRNRAAGRPGLSKLSGKRATFALAAFALVSLSACRTVGPNYQRPEVPLPATYSGGALGTASTPVPDAWWSLFGDPKLDRLVGEALAANQDLAAAAGRIEEARALLGLSRANRLPQVSGGASSSRSRLSQQASQIPPGFPLEFNDFRATIDASYEFDFWGKYSRASEAARAELLASEEGRRNVRLGIAASVATAYFDLLSFDRQLAIVRETLGTRGESVKLQQLRFDAGTISELDLAQAQAEMASAEATAPALERAIRQTENALGVLLGRFGTGPIERAGEGGLTTLNLPPLPAQLPSDLLLRRPDVAAAELGLIAANARIGEARAAFFPSFSLTASLGQETNKLSKFFSSGGDIFSLALGLTQPIWNAGRIRRNVEAVTARRSQALAAYLRSIQASYADVEDALAARTTGAAEREALERQAEALGRSLRLSQLRYDAGESSYFEVLDAQRGLLSAQLSAARARRDELAAAVTLFKALGGGWEEGAKPETSPAPEKAPE